MRIPSLLKKLLDLAPTDGMIEKLNNLLPRAGVRFSNLNPTPVYVANYILNLALEYLKKATSFHDDLPLYIKTRANSFNRILRNIEYKLDKTACSFSIL